MSFDLRVFVATWNVGGQSPNGNLDLSDFLHFRNESDIYVLGYILFLKFLNLFTAKAIYLIQRKT